MWIPNRFKLEALSLIAALAVARVARAEQTETDVARQLRVEAAAAAEKGDWDTCRAKAGEAFREAKQAQSAGLWGLCDFEVAAFRDAAEHLDYATRFDTDPTRKERYSKPLDDAKTHIGLIDASAVQSGTTIVLDDKPVGEAPVVLYVNPGHYKVEGRKTGFESQVMEFDLVAGTAKPARFDLRQVATPKSGLPLWPGILTVSTGVVLGAVGGGLFGLRGSQREDAVTLAKGRTCGGADPCTDVADAISTANSTGNAGIGLVVTGSVLAAGGVALMIVSAVTGASSKKPDAGFLTDLVVAPTFTAHSGGFVLGGSF